MSLSLLNQLPFRWFFGGNPDQRKLRLSLVGNLTARLPAMIGLLWFLPLLRFGLGTNDYAEVLSALALGYGLAFLGGGVSTIGRRVIGEAYARGDIRAEAQGFVSLMVAGFWALLVTLSIVIAFYSVLGWSFLLLLVACIPAFNVFLASFDNVRSAYNEHYVTAVCAMITQLIFYAIGVLVPATRHGVLIGAIILSGHYALTSLITGALMLRERPYLLRAYPRRTRLLVFDGARIGLADGLLMATLALSVVWLERVSGSQTAAWYATVVRLFQSFLLPVLLIVAPLSSYVRIRWAFMTRLRQQNFIKLLMWGGIGYGVIFAVGLFLVSEFYIEYLLHLPQPVNGKALPMFVLFAAIVAYRTYSAIAYLIINDPHHLSLWTTMAICVAAGGGAACHLAGAEGLTAVGFYSASGGFMMLIVVMWNALRYGTTLRISDETPT